MYGCRRVQLRASYAMYTVAASFGLRKAPTCIGASCATAERKKRKAQRHKATQKRQKAAWHKAAKAAVTDG
jgi:hypothetical protein